MPSTPIPRRLREIQISQSPGQRRVDFWPDDASTTSAVPVDFSHGDVDAFPPHLAAGPAFNAAMAEGGRAAYTPYRGNAQVRVGLARRLAELTGAHVDPERELIITPGTQAGLFLGLASLVEQGDRVGIVEPDYFANRRIVQFLGGEIVPFRLDLFGESARPLDIGALRRTMREAGARVLCLSNPNNPSGYVFEPDTVSELADMAISDGVFVVIDQLYSRQVFTDRPYSHLRSHPEMSQRCLTLMGPSKTESLSGFRIGTAIGPDWLIERMEAALSIACLRAPAYGQRVLDTWLNEEEGWLEERVAAHRDIRDRILKVLELLPGARVRSPEGGSYLFVQLPPLQKPVPEFLHALAQRQGVTVTPGTEFGPGFDDFFRINFSQDADAAVAAVERLVTLANDLLLP
jgi:aspartate/methionine/tyrosine aminotransferase